MSLYNILRPDSVEKMQGDYTWVVERIMAPGSNHVTLLFGPTGSGKTSLAKICAKAVGAEDFDTEELDFSSKGGIEEVRRIEADLQHAWGTKVYILDEVGRMTPDAQKAMRIMLENVADNVYFFLCTSDISKLQADLMGRCARVQMPALDEDQLMAILAEGVALLEFTGAKPATLARIADKSGGSGRVALDILQSIHKADPSQYARIIDGYDPSPEDATAFELAKELFGGSDWKVIGPILKQLKEQKIDGEGVRRVLLGYISSICIKAPTNWWAVKILSNNVYDSGLNGVIGMVGEIYEGGKR